MRATLLYGPRDIRVEDVPDPVILDPGDAVVRVLLACVCGSDLWDYRGVVTSEEPLRMGHEFVGVVEDVGSDVRSIKRGAIVVAPFWWGDGTCAACRSGWPTSCDNGGMWGTQGADGGQGEAVRVRFADANLVACPVDADDQRLPALVTLSDVLSTGHHAAVSAGVTAGSTVAVVGDGAVGLCAVLAARRLGAERIILLSRNETRAEVGRGFGATDIVDQRAAAGAAAVLELTEGRGADHALECVGTDQSWASAVGAVRIGGSVGYVGVPLGVREGLPLFAAYRRNVTIAGGVSPARTYLSELLGDVLSGALDPSPIFDRQVQLADVSAGYAAMDDRSAIKVLVKP